MVKTSTKRLKDVKSVKNVLVEGHWDNALTQTRITFWPEHVPAPVPGLGL